MPTARLVKEEEVIMNIEGVIPAPDVSFVRPRVLCESCKPLFTASSKRARRTVDEIRGAGLDSHRWRRADGLRPGRGGRSTYAISNTLRAARCRMHVMCCCSTDTIWYTNKDEKAEASDAADYVQEFRSIKTTTPVPLASPSHDEAIRSGPPYHNFAAYLKNEWPDYWQAYFFNKQDKLRQIRKRPMRKQMFGRPALYSRLCPEAPLVPIVINTRRPLTQYETHSKLAARVDSHCWEDLDSDRKPKMCKTLEEFFDLPALMMPIISNGALAYRDGTLSRNGRLPRAREVFKP